MANLTRLVTYGPEAWNMLQGVFCVYKPADMSIKFVRNVVVGNLCRDLNVLEPRPPRPLVAIEGLYTTVLQCFIATQSQNLIIKD